MRYRIGISIVFILFYGGIASAQESETRSTGTMTGTLVDQRGIPVSGVLVKSYISGNKTWSGKDGTFHLVTARKDYLYFNKEGYNDVSLNSEESDRMDTIVMTNSQGIQNHSLNPVNFDITSAVQTTGSVFRVSGEDLRRNPTNDLMLALSGLVPGFFSVQTSNTPGSVNYDNHLRGESPVILLDGVPRDIVIDLQEISEVLIYKDHAAAAMYGNLGANGIINIITRKGHTNTKVVEADYQVGLHLPLALPDFLDAYQNALLQNKARQNDGLDPQFGPDQLQAFQNGSDPLRYPDIDYFDRFMRANTNSHQLTTTFLGGDSTIQYYLHGGYLSNRGLESIGERINFDQILLRSDLRVQLNEIIRMDLGITGWMDISRFPRMGRDGMFGIMSSYPAYATPLMMGDSIFIVNRDYPQNLQSGLTSEGFSQSTRRTLNFNLGLTFNLDKLVRGLSMKHYVSLDLYNELVRGTGGNPNLYEPLFTVNDAGEDTTILNIYTHEFQDLDIGHMDDDITRHYTYYFNLDYDREIGDGHFLNTDLLYFQNALERRGKTGDEKNQMLNGKINYSFRNRYIIDLFMAYNGTQKLSGSNQFRFFPGFGVAWIASSESFLRNSPIVSFLKLRASYGESGYFNISEYYVYRDTWYSSGSNVIFGTKDKYSDYPAYELTQTGNPDADWPVVKKLNAGIDASFLKNSLSLAMDVYQNSYSGLLDRLIAYHPGIEGDTRFIPYENYNATERRGIEAGISYHNRAGEFGYMAGGTFAWSKERYTRIAELDYPDSYRTMEGKRTDAIWGLESNGLFLDQEDIASSATQMFGPVYPGDIKYTDQNGDGLLDERDEVIIGYSSPTVNIGIHCRLVYKNFSLFLQGAGTFGSDLVLNNPYYRNYGKDTYSAFMLNDYPRLTTYGSSNNLRLSDYWMSDGAFFRLKMVEFSYSLPANTLNALQTGLRIFVRGNNLLTFSGMEDLDPENIDAGVTMYPLYKTWAVGISIAL